MHKKLPGIQFQSVDNALFAFFGRVGLALIFVDLK